MDCSPPGSSVHGIIQARILEWAAISSFRGYSQPRDWTWVSCISRWILYHLSLQGRIILLWTPFSIAEIGFIGISDLPVIIWVRYETFSGILQLFPAFKRWGSGSQSEILLLWVIFGHVWRGAAKQLYYNAQSAPNTDNDPAQKENSEKMIKPNLDQHFPTSLFIPATQMQVQKQLLISRSCLVVLMIQVLDFDHCCVNKAVVMF